MKENNEISTHSRYCPKCGKQYQWTISREPKYDIVVLYLRCIDCGTFDGIALSNQEFLDNLFGGIQR